MAVTASLVFVGHNSIRYLLVQDGAAGTTATITTTGAVSPDLLTDSVQGPLKKLAKAFTDGFGVLSPGALTQAQARALWLSNWTADPAAGDPAGVISAIKTAKVTWEPDSVGLLGWFFDANVDGGGHPTINITAPAAASQGYLDIAVDNAIGA